MVVSCPTCHHPAHGTNPCAACTTAGQGLCWQPIKPTGGTIDTKYNEISGAAGVIELATGMEQRPCFLCRSFEKDEKKLVNHLLARGLKPDPDGSFVTPIVGDFKNRTSLRIHPSQYGYCRRHTMPVDMQATCIDWAQVRTASEMESRIK